MAVPHVNPAIRPIPKALYAPRYWLAWLSLGLLRLLALLPLPVMLGLGALLGELFHLLVPSRRRIVRINLRLCFPELDDATRRKLGRRHFRALGMGLFEMALCWFASDRWLRRRVTFEGLEHLHAAQVRGCGILLLSGHFTTMELGCRLVQVSGHRFHAMYRPADNAFFDYWIRRLRDAAIGLPMIPKNDLKGIVRCLRKGATVWYGPDQALETPSALFVDFFGQPVLTLTATSRLAEMGRAVVLPYFPQRIGPWYRSRYRVVFKPPLENLPSGDDAADARRVNVLLEEAIRAVPEQYFWVHRRFKDGPPGRSDPYAR